MAHVALDTPQSSPVAANAAEVLGLVMRIRDLKDGAVGLRSGIGSRSAIQERRSGKKLLDLRDIDLLSAALNVAPEVFLMDPVQAQMWVAQHAPRLDVPYDSREVGEQSSP